MPSVFKNANPLRGSLAISVKTPDFGAFSTRLNAATANSVQPNMGGGGGGGGGAGGTNAAHPPATSNFSFLPLRLRLRLAFHVVLFSVRLRRIARFAVRLTRHETFMVKEAYHKQIRSGTLLKIGGGGEGNGGEGGMGAGSEAGGDKNKKNGPTLSLVPTTFSAKAQAYSEKEHGKRENEEDDDGEAMKNPRDPAVIIFKLAETLGVSDISLADSKVVVSRLLRHHQGSKASASNALLKAIAGPKNNANAAGPMLHHGQSMSMNAGAFYRTASALGKLHRTLSSASHGCTNNADVVRNAIQNASTKAGDKNTTEILSSTATTYLKPGEILSEDVAVRAIELLKQLSVLKEREEMEEHSLPNNNKKVPLQQMTFNNTRRLELANTRLGLAPSGAPLIASEGGGSNHAAIGRNHRNNATPIPSSSSPPPSLMNSIAVVNASSSTTTAAIQQQTYLKRRLVERSQEDQQMWALFEMLVLNSRQGTPLEEVVALATTANNAAAAVSTGAAAASSSSRPGTANGGVPDNSTAPLLHPLRIRPQIPLLENLITCTASPSSSASLSSAQAVNIDTNKNLTSLLLVQQLLDAFGLKVDALSWCLRTIPLPILFPFGNFVSQRTRQLRERLEGYKKACGGGGNRRATLASPSATTASSASSSSKPINYLDEKDPDNEGGYAGLGGSGYFGIKTTDWLTVDRVNNGIPADYKKAGYHVTYAELVTGGNLTGILNHSATFAADSGRAYSRQQNSGDDHNSEDDGDSGLDDEDDEYGRGRQHRTTTRKRRPSSAATINETEESDLSSTVTEKNSTNVAFSPTAASPLSPSAASAASYLSKKALQPFSDKTRQIIRSLTLEDAFISMGHFAQILDRVPANNTPTLTTTAKESTLSQMASEAAKASERQAQSNLIDALKAKQQQILQQKQMQLQRLQQQQMRNSSNSASVASLFQNCKTAAGARTATASMSPQRQAYYEARKREKEKKQNAAQRMLLDGGGSSSPSDPTSSLNPTTAAILIENQLAQIEHNAQRAAIQEEKRRLPSHLDQIAFKQKEEEIRYAASALLLGANNNGQGNSNNNNRNGRDEGGAEDMMAPELKNTAGRGGGGLLGPDDVGTSIAEQIQLHRLVRGSNVNDGLSATNNNGRAHRTPSVSNAAAGGGQGPDANNKGKPQSVNTSTATANNNNDDLSAIGPNTSSSAIPVDDSFHFRSIHSNNASKKILFLSRNFSDPKLTSMGQRAQQAVETLEVALDDKLRGGGGTTGGTTAGGVTSSRSNLRSYNNNGPKNGGMPMSVTEKQENDLLALDRASQNALKRQLRHNQALHAKDRGYSPAIGGRGLWKLNDHGAFGLDPRSGKPIITRKDAVFESSLIGRFSGHARRRKGGDKKKRRRRVTSSGKVQRLVREADGSSYYVTTTDDDDGTANEDDDNDDSYNSSSSSDYDAQGRKIVDPYKYVQSPVREYVDRPLSRERTNIHRTLNNNNNDSRGNASSMMMFAGDQFVRCNDLVIPTLGGVSNKHHIRAQSACSDRNRPSLAMLVPANSPTRMLNSRNGNNPSHNHSDHLPPRPHSSMGYPPSMNTFTSNNPANPYASRQAPIQGNAFNFRPHTASAPTKQFAGRASVSAAENNAQDRNNIGSSGKRVGDLYLGNNYSLSNNHSSGGGGASFSGTYNPSNYKRDVVGYGPDGLPTTDYSRHNNQQSTMSISSSNPVKDMFDNRPQSEVARRLRRQLPTPTIDALAGTPSFVLPTSQRARIMYAHASPVNGGIGGMSLGGINSSGDTPMNRETVSIAGAVLGALQNNKYFSTRNSPL